MGQLEGPGLTPTAEVPTSFTLSQTIWVKADSVNITFFDVFSQLQGRDGMALVGSSKNTPPSQSLRRRERCRLHIPGCQGFRWRDLRMCQPGLACVPYPPGWANLIVVEHIAAPAKVYHQKHYGHNVRSVPHANPKIHKPDVLVRPIVDGIGSPPHELARFLAGILKPLTGKSSTYIKNSYDFANKVAGVTVEPDDILSVFASIASSMFRRVRALCTEEVDRTAAQIEVINKLRGSGYPASLIRRQLRRVLVPVEKPKREWLGTAVIPYKPGTSETIRRILNTANIRVGFQRGNTLRSALVQLKDRLPANRTRDCVYKIKCSDCIKVYIGQTARELHTRIVEHKRKINKPPRNADEYRALLKDSAIAEHALDTGHKIDLENVEVLRRGLRSTSQRLMAEAVEIAKHPSVNRIEGVELARVWRTVLDQSS
ncbi:hypothetical protein CLF_103950 [Clonorchis sinensis]|uniref:C2H2-type domain-containing protein n=1 Tax=Clonorchis sinensis TaxID=79923 RepID=G7YAP9_CLOSI|nr:hypothetical protein CLF_103950 [Clonorchis sinensis]